MNSFITCIKVANMKHMIGCPYSTFDIFFRLTKGLFDLLKISIVPVLFHRFIESDLNIKFVKILTYKKDMMYNRLPLRVFLVSN